MRAWVQAWGAWQGPGTLAWEERRWARLGTQRLPARLELATPAQAADWAGQAPRWARAVERAARLAGRWPQWAGRPGLGRLFGVLADWHEADFERLVAALAWLQGVTAFCWGDIDTHGLAILERARRALPGLRSLLMDEATLLAYRPLWGEEPQQHPGTGLETLTADERRLFEDLRGGRWGPRVRLEQERLPWDAALAAIEAALGSAVRRPDLQAAGSTT